MCPKLTQRMIKVKNNLAIIGDLAYETTVTNLYHVSQLGGSGYYAAIGAIAAKNNGFVLVSSVGEDFHSEETKISKTNLLLNILPNQKTARFTTTYLNDSERLFQADFGALVYPPYQFAGDIISAQLVLLTGSDPHKQLVWIQALLDKGFNGTIACDTFEKYCVDYPDIVMKVIEKSKYVFMNNLEQSILQYNPATFSKISIIKNGENGADLYMPQRNVVHYSSVNKYHVEDTNGAGDILAGSFLSFVLNGLSYEEALCQSVRQDA